MLSSSFLLLSLFLVTLSYLTSCHQGLFEPKDLIRGPARNGKPEWFSTKEAPFPCKHNDLTAAQRQYPINQKVFRPGQSIELVWPRNNHQGGFIAVTLVPFDKSSNKAEVENPNNVIMYACAQQSCRGNSQYNRFNGPSICSQQQGGNCLTCSLTVPIPSHVPTGTYTIQWRLFGHFDSSGVPNRALMDYATCLDLKIENPNPSPRPACPAMIGNNCEHFKGVTDINQLLGGERETGSRNNRASFVDKGVPRRVQQCQSNPPAPPPTPKPTPKPTPPPTSPPTPQPTPKPAPQPTPPPATPPPATPPPATRPQVEPRPAAQPASSSDESVSASLSAGFDKLSNQLSKLVDKFDNVQTAVISGQPNKVSPAVSSDSSYLVAQFNAGFDRLSQQLAALLERFNQIQIAVVQKTQKR